GRDFDRHGRVERRGVGREHSTRHRDDRRTGEQRDRQAIDRAPHATCTPARPSVSRRPHHSFDDAFCCATARGFTATSASNCLLFESSTCAFSSPSPCGTNQKRKLGFSLIEKLTSATITGLSP